MANTMNLEGRQHMSYCNYGGNTFLLPRSPFPNLGSTVVDHTGRRSSRNLSRQYHHHRTPSVSILLEEPPSWFDDLLDDAKPHLPPTSNTSTKLVSHRRSASDSFAFMDTPKSVYKISNIIEEEEYYDDSTPIAPFSSTGTHFDSVSRNKNGMPCLVAEIEQLQRQRNLPVSILKLQTENVRAKYGLTDPVSELASEQCAISGVGDSELDPSQGRNIANRHSAQRSRVRKMQYIAELEATVNALQTEVSAISPRVAYFEHERKLLHVDNSRLKQRIALLLQDRKVKDALSEALKVEAQRCKRLYEIQFQKHLQLKQKTQHTKEMVEDGNKSSSSSGPSDFVGLLKEFSNFSIETSTKVASCTNEIPRSLPASTIPPGFNVGKSNNNL